MPQSETISLPDSTIPKRSRLPPSQRVCSRSFPWKTCMNTPKVNAMDVVERSCTVTACTKNYNVMLKVNFPVNYPCSAQPTFQFCPIGTSIDNAMMTKLLKVLVHKPRPASRREKQVVLEAVSPATECNSAANFDEAWIDNKKGNRYLL